MRGVRLAWALAVVLDGAAGPAGAEETWAQARAAADRELAKGDLRSVARAIEIVQGRAEPEAVRAVASLLAAWPLERAGGHDDKALTFEKAVLARNAALRTLQEFEAPPAIEELLRVAEKAEWEVATVALVALGRIGGRLRSGDAAAAALYARIVTTLRAAVAAPHPIRRTCATQAIGRLGDPALDPLLVGQLADLAWQARVEAVWALGRDAAHVDALIAALPVHAGRVATEIRTALARLTDGDFGLDADAWREWWAANRDRTTAERRAAKAARSRTRAVSAYCQIPVDSQRVAFVLDVTGSMHVFHENDGVHDWLKGEAALKRPTYDGQTVLELAKYQVANVVHELPPAATFALVFYSSDRVYTWQPGMRAATPEHAEKVRRFLNGVGPSGDTNTYDGLRRALNLSGSQLREWIEGPDTIFLFTDGAANAGTLHEPEDIFDVVAALAGFRRVRLNSVTFGPWQKWLYESLARRTSGASVDVPIRIDAVREAGHSHGPDGG